MSFKFPSKASPRADDFTWFMSFNLGKSHARQGSLTPLHNWKTRSSDTDDSFKLKHSWKASAGRAGGECRARASLSHHVDPLGWWEGHTTAPLVSLLELWAPPCSPKPTRLHHHFHQRSPSPWVKHAWCLPTTWTYQWIPLILGDSRLPWNLEPKTAVNMNWWKGKCLVNCKVLSLLLGFSFFS